MSLEDISPMWRDCMLDGTALDAAVAECLGMKYVVHDKKCWAPHSFTLFQPHKDWAVLGPLVEPNGIFLDPPHRAHVIGGPLAGVHVTDFWTATVSARVRTFPNPVDPLLPACVGRGMGERPELAICRAIVASFGPRSK